MSTHSQSRLHAALRAHARGLYASEAAAELLIAHDTWLHRHDFLNFVRLGASSSDHIQTADIDWPAAITALAAGELPCSGGERRMLRLTASLAAGIPVDLRHALVGLDDRNISRVITAIRHTSGRRQALETHDHF